VADRANLDHLLAQWWECPVDAATEAVDRNLAAWKQAMAEFGVPDHPGGKCPSLPCPCSAMTELITFRAYELLGLPASAAAED
jgi:hypothetical protein